MSALCATVLTLHTRTDRVWLKGKNLSPNFIDLKGNEDGTSGACNKLKF